MRTQEAFRIVNKEMRKFYNVNVCDLPDLSILQCFKQKRVYQALNQLSKHCEREENNYLIKCGYEPKPLNDPYPDVVSIRGILGKMFYISDRWYCAQRIKFILRIIKEI